MNQIQKPVILVTGAAGLQGGAVIKALLAQGNVAIRAIVRDKNSEGAQALVAQNIECLTRHLLGRTVITSSRYQD